MSALLAVLLVVQLPVAAPRDDAELSAIFAADQGAREGELTAEDWTGLREKDAARRERVRVRALIAAGRVKTGTDLYHAAFVFQHGYEADD